MKFYFTSTTENLHFFIISDYALFLDNALKKKEFRETPVSQMPQIYLLFIVMPVFYFSGFMPLKPVVAVK